MKNKFRMILLFICGLIFATSVFFIIYTKYKAYEEEKIIEQIQQEKDSNSISEEDKQEKEGENKSEDLKEENNILPKYQELYKENQDLIGWISIEGTEINYPVMFTPQDPNYYLYKNWKKEDSNSGSIFIDGRTTQNTENIIVYGHKMKNGSMFGSLEKYKDEEYYQEHRIIEFDSIYQERTFEIIAVSKAIIYYDEVPKNEYLFYENVELDNEEKFNEYIDYMKENSYFEIEESAKYGDQLITLCTCDYWAKDARLLIVAKEITK